MPLRGEDQRAVLDVFGEDARGFVFDLSGEQNRADVASQTETLRAQRVVLVWETRSAPLMNAPFLAARST